VIALWSQIRSLIGMYAPESIARLQGGASGPTRDALRASIGLELPDDLRASLAVHDGQRPPYMSSVLFNSEYLLPADQIAAVWSSRKEVADDLELHGQSATSVLRWWDPLLVPVTESNGDGFCVHSGTGAVHYHTHDGELEGPLFSSWRAFLENLADSIENGRFRVHLGGVWLKH
jgi:cell wall assembly regulator SMI1